jgi:hypothetical protein
MGRSIACRCGYSPSSYIVERKRTVVFQCRSCGKTNKAKEKHGVWKVVYNGSGAFATVITIGAFFGVGTLGALLDAIGDAFGSTFS